MRQNCRDVHQEACAGISDRILAVRNLYDWDILRIGCDVVLCLFRRCLDPDVYYYRGVGWCASCVRVVQILFIHLAGFGVDACGLDFHDLENRNSRYARVNGICF